MLPSIYSVIVAEVHVRGSRVLAQIMGGKWRVECVYLQDMQTER